MDKKNKISAKSLSKNKKNVKVNVQSQQNKINEQRVQQKVQIQPQLSKQIISQYSSYKLKIQSPSSAFKPFSNILQYSNKFSQQQQHSNFQQFSNNNISHLLQQNVSSYDPTLRLFNNLRKLSALPLTFDLQQLALAKCFHQPLWPCRILQIKNIPQLSQEIYHIKFINDNNFSYVNQCHLLKFNSKNVEELRKVCEQVNLQIKEKQYTQKYSNQKKQFIKKNKKLLKGLKMAEKLKEKQQKQQKQKKINMNNKYIKQQDGNQYVLQTQVYSLSSQQQYNKNYQNNKNLHVHVNNTTPVITQNNINNLNNIRRTRNGFYIPQPHLHDNINKIKKTKNYLHYHYSQSHNQTSQFFSQSHAPILQQNEQNHQNHQNNNKKNKKQKQYQPLSTLSTTQFKPIILFQDNNIQINLMSLKEMNNKIQNEQIIEEEKQKNKQQKKNNNNLYKQKRIKIKNKPQSLSLLIDNNNNNNNNNNNSNSNIISSKQRQNHTQLNLKQQHIPNHIQPSLSSIHKSHNKSLKTPINLIIQTPKLHKNYYLNKIILKFQQAQSSNNQSNYFSSLQLLSQQQMDETRMQQAKQINKLIKVQNNNNKNIKNNQIKRKQQIQVLIKLMKQYYQEIKDKKFQQHNEQKEKIINKGLEKIKIIKEKCEKNNNLILYKKIIKWYNQIIKGYQNVNKTNIFSNKKCQQSINKLKRFIQTHQKQQQSASKLNKCTKISITRNKKQKKSQLKFLQDQKNQQSRIELSLSLSNSTNILLNNNKFQNNNHIINHKTNNNNKFLI